ncbi:hypothetical protein BDR04DRAFT_1099639 [Suillus decipiens]|nr:hypothetical protein BDR04DRAFT_1099639 [Suillus decipiens]
MISKRVEYRNRDKNDTGMGASAAFVFSASVFVSLDAFLGLATCSVDVNSFEKVGFSSSAMTGRPSVCVALMLRRTLSELIC